MLAAGTKEVHEKAENTQFVKDFLRGRIRKELFKVRLQEIMTLLLNFNVKEVGSFYYHCSKQEHYLLGEL